MATDDLLGVIYDPLEQFLLCHRVAGKLHFKAESQSCAGGGHQQFLWDVVFCLRSLSLYLTFYNPSNVLVAQVKTFRVWAHREEKH